MKLAHEAIIASRSVVHGSKLRQSSRLDWAMSPSARTSKGFLIVGHSVTRQADVGGLGVIEQAFDGEFTELWQGFAF